MKAQKKMLGTAISIAVGAHVGKFDRGGNPYILHLLSIMSQLMYDTELAIIGVLHDVVEDSGYSLRDLRGVGYSDRVLVAIDLLTHKVGVPYEDYITLICTNQDAITVKRKDLQHNLDITRLEGVKEEDLLGMEKYHKAFIELGKARCGK